MRLKATWEFHTSILHSSSKQMLKQFRCKVSSLTLFVHDVIKGDVCGNRSHGYMGSPIAQNFRSNCKYIFFAFLLVTPLDLDRNVDKTFFVEACDSPILICRITVRFLFCFLSDWYVCGNVNHFKKRRASRSNSGERASLWILVWR